MDSATEEEIRGLFTDEQPGLDLRESGLALAGRTLRVHVRTDGPIRSALFEIIAFTPVRCGDAQLVALVRVADDGTASVEATDRLDGDVRPVEAAVEVDGEHLTLALPLLAAPRRFYDLTVTSADGNALEEASYSDSIPDIAITGAGFTRGTGTPNYVGGWTDACGPADPPLLPR